MLREGMPPAGTIVAASIAILIVIVSNLLAWSLWNPTLIMDDGVQYLSTAANWLSGNGFSTNALIYEPHFQGVLPAPQTVWPPGLPFLQAMVSITGIELKTAALLINLSANVLSALFVYLILRRCRTGNLFSITCAAIYYLASPSWMFAAALISEPLFSVFLLASIYCLPDEDGRQSERLLLSGLLVAASICTRYSAVFGAAAIVIALFLLLIIRTRRAGLIFFSKGVKGLALFGFLPALAFALLLYRTGVLTGTVERRTGVIESKSLAETFIRLAEEASVLTGFRDGLIFRNDIDTWMFVLFVFLVVVAVVTAVIVLVLNRSDTTLEPVPFRATVMSIMLTHAVAFVGYLLYSSLSDTPLNITSRYLYQVYPGLLIVMFLLVASVFVRASTTVLSVYRWIIGILVCMYLVAQFNMFGATRDLTRRAIDSSEIVGLQVSDGITLSDVVQSCVGSPTSVEQNYQTALWSNDAVLLHLNTGVNTISLPSTYATDSFNFERWQRDIETYSIRLFIFINREQSKSGLYGEMLEKIEGWLRDSQYPILQMQDNQLESGATVTVYLANSRCLEEQKN